MNKAISLLLLFAITIALVLCSCAPQQTEEPTTDNNQQILDVIDKSSPITTGNLITKTETDENGNLNINYFDSNGNLVENFVWSDDENISHSLMKYSGTDLLVQKEDISPDGQRNKVESYQYDDNNKVQKTTVSEFEDGKLKTSTIFNADNKKISKSLSFYENNRLSKVERYDADDKLEEYYVYEYNTDGKNIKYSAFYPDGTLKKYTTFEYNEKGLLETEKYFDGNNNPDGYYSFTYHDSGNMKSSAYYDKDGKKISEDIFEDIA
ncbi:MAG: hypothetical protein J6Q94_06305 [Clostridia bacterium]|nr:hypothetical protein [Clostridia bacterium]